MVKQAKPLSLASVTETGLQGYYGLLELIRLTCLGHHSDSDGSFSLTRLLLLWSGIAVLGSFLSRSGFLLRGLLQSFGRFLLTATQSGRVALSLRQLYRATSDVANGFMLTATVCGVGFAHLRFFEKISCGAPS